MIVDRVCDPLRGSAWSRCKNSFFFAILAVCGRTLCGDRRGRGAKTRFFFFFFLRCADEPSAGIGVVEVQQLEVFCDFCLPARPSQCGDWRGRGAKTRFFAILAVCGRNPLRGSVWSRYKNSRFFAISVCPRDPLRGLAWSRCKNSVLCDSCGVRTNPLRGSAWSRCENSRFFAFLRCADESCAGIVRVDVAPCEFVLVVRVEALSRWKIAALKRRCILRGAPPQLSSG